MKPTTMANPALKPIFIRSISRVTYVGASLASLSLTFIFMNRTVRCEQIRPVCSGGDMVPGRSGHRIICIANDIYVIGGYVQLPTGLEVLGEVWAFNLLAERWRRLNLPNCPFRLALSACALAVGNRVLIHGGTGIPFAEEINNTVIEIDVVTEQCKEHACVPKNADEKNIPEATYGHSLTYVCLSEDENNSKSLGGGMLVKVGGARGAPYSNVVSAFSFSTGTWERLFGGEGVDSLETFTPRYRHDAIFWNEELYIIGGTNFQGSLPFWPMPVFDIRRRGWRYVNFSGRCPPPIRYSCSVHFDNVVYTTGGVMDETDELNNLVFAFNLESLVFYIVGSQPLPTFFHDLTVAPGRYEFFSFGGVREETRVNHLHRFRLVHRPSSLAELCWQQVARLLRAFFPPDLATPHLLRVLRAASTPLLGLPSAASTFDTSPAAPGVIAVASDTASGSVQSLFAYTKSIFSYLLSHLGYMERKQRYLLVEPTSDSAEVFFDSMMAVVTDIVNSTKERQLDPVECVSIFLTVLFYCNGAPLQYVTRLPYGFRCLNTVCRYMEKLSGNVDAEESTRPYKRMYFAPASEKCDVSGVRGGVYEANHIQGD
ncbi:Kelch domain-containing protein 10 -like protein [Echinococcus granulosus]|nr:Kelch domain-containing protein 10 -like protein [Echinococcus granulosus]